MKEPKLIKRNRDRVYSIVFNQNNSHKYKSLGTKNKMEAETVVYSKSESILSTLNTCG